MITAYTYSSVDHLPVFWSLIKRNVGHFREKITYDFLEKITFGVTYKSPSNGAFCNFRWNLLNIACVLRYEEFVDVILQTNPAIIHRLFKARIGIINKINDFSVLELLSLQTDEISARIFYKIISVLDCKLYEKEVHLPLLKIKYHIIHPLIECDNLLQIRMLFHRLTFDQTKAFVEDSTIAPSLITDVKRIILDYNPFIPSEHTKAAANAQLVSVCPCPLKGCPDDRWESPLSLLTSRIYIKKIKPTNVHIEIAFLLLAFGADIYERPFFSLEFHGKNYTLFGILQKTNQSWILDLLKNHFGIDKDLRNR